MMKANASDQPPPALLRMNNYVNNSLQTECFAKYSQHNRDRTNYCVLSLTHNVLLLKYVMFVSLKHFFYHFTCKHALSIRKKSVQYNFYNYCNL